MRVYNFIVIFSNKKQRYIIIYYILQREILIFFSIFANLASTWNLKGFFCISFVWMKSIKKYVKYM